MTKTLSRIALILSVSLGLLVAVPAFAETGITATASHFLHELGLGSSGRDVLELQALLNRNQSTQVTENEISAGFPGKEGMYFGTLTKAAVVKFQTIHGIKPTGYVGPLTLAALNAAYADTSVVMPHIQSLSVVAKGAGVALVTMTYEGGGEAPKVWFAFGATADSTTLRSEVQDGNPHGGIMATSGLGLASGQDYYFRGYVKNSAGTATSQVVKLTIPAQ